MIAKQDILAAFNYRHACKEFDDSRKIGPEDFDFILETGRLSPSSFGMEPWRFVVMQDMALREKLLDVSWGAKKQFPTASHAIAILARKGQDLRFDADYVRHMRLDIHHMPPDLFETKNKFYRQFQETDFDLLGSERALFDWACRQTYIALGNMMTAAAMIGIDSCPIEGFEQAGADRILAEAGVMDPKQFGLAVMVTFGYRKNPQPTKTRQAMSEIVQWLK